MVGVVIDEMTRIESNSQTTVETVEFKTMMSVLHGFNAFLYMDTVSMMQLSSLVASLGSEKLNEMKNRMNDSKSEKD